MILLLFVGKKRVKGGGVVKRLSVRVLSSVLSPAHLSFHMLWETILYSVSFIKAFPNNS